MCNFLSADTLADVSATFSSRFAEKNAESRRKNADTKRVTKFPTFGSQDDLVSLKLLAILMDQSSIKKVIFARVTSEKS